MNEQQFQRLKSEIIFRDDTLGLRKDLVRTPSGEFLWRKVVEYQKASTVVALTKDLRVLLIRHFRYSVNAYIWDIPGGMIQASEGASACAQRELFEETGYQAERLEHLVDFYPEPAFTNHTISIFIGYGLLLSSTLQQREEEIDRIAFFKLSETPRMISDGLIGSSWTIVGLMMALYSKFDNRSKGAF
jgi:ADP-ribose pyrophosphatase